MLKNFQETTIKKDCGFRPGPTDPWKNEGTPVRVMSLNGHYTLLWGEGFRFAWDVPRDTLERIIADPLEI